MYSNLGILIINPRLKKNMNSEIKFNMALFPYLSI